MPVFRRGKGDDQDRPGLCRSVTGHPQPPGLGRRTGAGVGAAVAVAGYGVGALTSSVEPIVGWGIVGGLAALLLMAASAYRPVVAIYVYLATLPFIAGIDRNNLIPLVRPNEAMLAVVLVGALIGGSFALVVVLPGPSPSPASTSHSRSSPCSPRSGR